MLFGQRLIILNNADDATTLLDKRGSNYSGRPAFTMGGELVGWNKSMAFLQYDEQLKQCRRYISQAMGSKNAVVKYHRLIELENRKFLRRLSQVPENVHEHIR